MLLFKKIFAVLLLFTLLYSCDNTDSFSSSSNFIESDIRIIDVDSFDIKMSTYRYDSIVTNADRLLVGRYIDPYFGEVRASSNIEFTPTSYNALDDNAVFDSIVLNLRYDGYYYNDTLLTKTIEVRKLAKEIRLPNSQTDYYNTTQTQVENEVIGYKSFRPRIGNDSLTVTLNPAVGLNIFNALQSNNVNDEEEFLNYLKGLNISPAAAEDASVVGFSPTGSYIRVYYSYPDQDAIESEYMDLTYTGANKFYNNIKGNYSGTLLQPLGGQENEMASVAIEEDLAFIQSGLGVMAKVTFPSIRNIREYNEGNGEIFKAQLKIKLDNRYNTRNYPLRDSVYVCTVDRNNDIIAYGGVGYIQRVSPENNEVYLTADVNFFLQQVLVNSQYLNYGLVFLPMSYSNSVDRIVLNGENNQRYKSRLTLTYVIYD